MANRQYKDSVFRKFFNNREELAKFYQAIRPDETIYPEDISINTLEDVILDQQKNDLSFVWKDQSIVLTEHQSTITPNMPARMLIYGSRLLLGTLADKKALYRKKLVFLPAIHFYELYIGDDMVEDEGILKLSSSFREGNADLELICHVINITYREDREILKKCQPLYEYSRFIAQIEHNRHDGMNLDSAIREVINYCIQHKIMQSFLENCREEVLQMMTFQWNADEAKKIQEEERLEDIRDAEIRGDARGEAKGEARGEARGIAATTMKIVRNLLKKKAMSYEEIADSTDTTLDEVMRIAKESDLSY